MGAFVTIVGLVIVLIAWAGVQQVRDAKRLYERSLASLKENPTDPDLRQRTLMFGRAYSNLTRNKKGVPAYDDVALANDISAAYEAAASSRSWTAAVQESTESRLARLADLKRKGLVSTDEYHEQRTRILADL